MSTPLPPAPYYRVSGSDLGLLEPFPDAGALLPGHIAAYYAGLGTRLRERPRSFFFEPSTWMFVRPPRYITKTRANGKNQIKLSFVAFAAVLGGPFAEIVGVSKLRIDRIPEEAIKEATQNWVTFQQEYTKSDEVEKLQTTLREYDELAAGGERRTKQKEEAPKPPPSPSWVTALSFPVTKKEDPWLGKTVESVEETIRIVGKERTLALLHVEGWSEGDVELFDALAAELPASIGIELWIDGHSDYGSSRNLADYLSVIKTLRRKHRTIVLAYSSLLGAYLSPLGVTAVASGMGTSEEKSSTSEPATGGGYARYYVPLSSKPERIADCRLFFTEHPEQFCTGDACKRILGRVPSSRIDFDAFFKDFMMPQSKAHFLEVRIRETEEISTQTIAVAAGRLRERMAQARSLNYENYFHRLPHHLDTWASAVEAI